MSDNLEPEDWDQFEPERHIQWWVYVMLLVVIGYGGLKEYQHWNAKPVVTQEKVFENWTVQCGDKSSWNSEAGNCVPLTRNGTRTVIDLNNGSTCTYDIGDPKKRCIGTNKAPNLFPNYSERKK